MHGKLFLKNLSVIIFNLAFVTYHKITESQNHRITESQNG